MQQQILEQKAQPKVRPYPNHFSNDWSKGQGKVQITGQVLIPEITVIGLLVSFQRSW